MTRTWRALPFLACLGLVACALDEPEPAEPLDPQDTDGSTRGGDQAADAQPTAPRVTRPVTVTAAPQTIAFPPIASFPWRGGAASLGATASSGLAVSYSVRSGPCRVDGSRATATMPGSCVIAADQAGNSRYDAAPPETATVMVTKADQHIELSAIEGVASGLAKLDATASSGLAVSYRVVSGPCRIEESTLMATVAGTCVVAAEQPGDASYDAAPQITASVTFAEVSRGGCSAAGDGARSNLVVVLAAVGLRRRRQRGC